MKKKIKFCPSSTDDSSPNWPVQCNIIKLLKLVFFLISSNPLARFHHFKRIHNRNIAPPWLVANYLYRKCIPLCPCKHVHDTPKLFLVYTIVYLSCPHPRIETLKLEPTRLVLSACYQAVQLKNKNENSNNDITHETFQAEHRYLIILA